MVSCCRLTRPCLLTRFSRMPINFLASLGGSLAERWTAILLTPAFIFWSGGLAAWIWRFGWQPLEQWLLGLSEPLQMAIIIGTLLGISTSAVAIQGADLPALRLLAGDWPRWGRPLKRQRLAQQRRWLQRAENRWQSLLAQQETRGLTPEESAEYVRLDAQLRRFPAQPEKLMPTRLGNLLQAAQDQPGHKYGLDAAICLPRLWLVLPNEVKTELQTARKDLNTAARLWCWGGLFCVWCIWAWWAAFVGGLTMVLAYRWLLRTAAVYGDLLEAAFDLHRATLYQALRWPLPRHPAEERSLGLALTAYLWRGSDQARPIFSHGESK